MHTCRFVFSFPHPQDPLLLHDTGILWQHVLWSHVPLSRRRRLLGGQETPSGREEQARGSTHVPRGHGAAGLLLPGHRAPRGPESLRHSLPPSTQNLQVSSYVANRMCTYIAHKNKPLKVNRLNLVMNETIPRIWHAG